MKDYDISRNKRSFTYVLRHRINIVEKNEIFDFINNEILNKVSVPNEE